MQIQEYLQQLPRPSCISQLVGAQQQVLQGPVLLQGFRQGETTCWELWEWGSAGDQISHTIYDRGNGGMVPIY